MDANDDETACKRAVDAEGCPVCARLGLRPEEMAIVAVPRRRRMPASYPSCWALCDQCGAVLGVTMRYSPQREPVAVLRPLAPVEAQRVLDADGLAAAVRRGVLLRGWRLEGCR